MKRAAKITIATGVALIVLAGVIPFLTFYVERKVVAELRARTETAPADAAGV